MNKRQAKKKNKYLINFLYDYMEKMIVLIYSKEVPSDRLCMDTYCVLYEWSVYYEESRIYGFALKWSIYYHYINLFYKKIIKKYKDILIDDIPQKVPDNFTFDNFKDSLSCKNFIIQMRPDLPENIKQYIYYL